MALSKRAKNLRPFHVMDILAQAKALSQQGKTIYHMEVGEPDFATAEC
jgi:aspartate/methionine/tyrosine aminotransferase